MKYSPPMNSRDWPVNNTLVNQAARGKHKTASPTLVQAAAQWSKSPGISLDITNVLDAPGDPQPIAKKDLDAIASEVIAVHRRLKAGQGDVNDGAVPMLGWLTLPDEISDEHLTRITKIARALQDRIDAFVSLGIGGSYLGLAAALSALTHTHYNNLSREERGNAPEFHFLGHNMDPDFFRDTLDLLRNKRVGINVISKSGTTTETAIAFRILRRLLEQNYGADARNLIVVTTDAHKGALRQLSQKNGYETFVVPENIGGRFSVLSDVGLVGLAMANIDLAEFVSGFRAMKQRTDGDDFWSNSALVHAAVRTLAWRKGKKVEVVATPATSLYQMARFMEQLFPESEGHKGKGMWVSPSLYSEKLHANGQMVQEGERNILETFLRLEQYDSTLPIPPDPENVDGLNYLSDQQRDLGYINHLVVHGPAYAHYKGGVPNMTINVPRRSAFYVGQLFFFLQRSVAISGTLLGHNPFIQPGVEAYKKAMFALAGKPGSEQLARTMKTELDARPRLIIQ